MSWTLSAAELPQDGLRDELAKRRDAYFDAFGPDAKTEMVEQCDAAIEAAVALADTLGDGPVNIDLSGHANPGHVPRAGWADDYVTISVRQGSS